MPAKKARKKPTAKPKTKPRTKKSKSNKVTVTQNTKVTVSGAGGGGGYGPPIVYATYAPPIPAGGGFPHSLPPSSNALGGRTPPQTTSSAAAQTSNMFSGRSSRETQTLGVATSSAAAQTLGVATSSAAAPTTVSLMPPKATYAPRDPGARTSATWESGNGFNPEKREPQRLTDHGVTINPKHASVQNQATSDMSIVENATLSAEDPIFTAVSNRVTDAIQRAKQHLDTTLRKKDLDLLSRAQEGLAEMSSKISARQRILSMETEKAERLRKGKAPMTVQTNSDMDSYRKLFSGKNTYAPRDPGASTSATWESGSGFKPEKREHQRLTDHGVTLTPKHSSVQSQATSDDCIDCWHERNGHENITAGKDKVWYSTTGRRVKEYKGQIYQDSHSVPR